jgi:CubicO group peptidase (beta-lactamase class C family)
VPGALPGGGSHVDVAVPAFLGGRVWAVSSESASALATYLSQVRRARHVPGMAVAVVQDGATRFAQGFGVASVEFDLPVDEHSVFHLASVTKIFTGVAMMKLVGSGQVQLETPVTEVLEGLPRSWHRVRIRHLLSHTSGLPRWEQSSGFRAVPDDERDAVSPADRVRFAAEVPLQFEPGARFSYGTTAYVAAGLVIERLTGREFTAFVHDEIFAPLGMASTTYGSSYDVVMNRNPVLYNRETGMLRTWVYSYAGSLPAAGANSSMTDMARFLSAVDQGQVLHPSLLAELWSPTTLSDGSRSGYGLGWTVAEHRGRTVVGHEGGGHTWVTHFPDEHLSVVILSNLNAMRDDEIQYEIADRFLAADGD